MVHFGVFVLGFSWTFWSFTAAHSEDEGTRHPRAQSMAHGKNMYVRDDAAKVDVDSNVTADRPLATPPGPRPSAPSPGRQPSSPVPAEPASCASRFETGQQEVSRAPTDPSSPVTAEPASRASRFETEAKPNSTLKTELQTPDPNQETDVKGFLGNGLVVCVLVKHRNQSNLTDICLFNLALSDLLFVLTLPFYSHYSRLHGHHARSHGGTISHPEVSRRPDRVHLDAELLLIPLLVMIVCYSRILPILVNMRSAKKQRVVPSIVTAFFLFWAPYNLSLFLEFLMSKGLLPNECSVEARLKLSITVTETVAYTRCCLNPVIYALAGQRFMKRGLPLLGVLLPSSRDLSDGSYRKSSVSRSSDGPSIM
ncbi:hypothetical protein JOQ06_026140 [Pogonophryne albipinna]|uniref:G-protein coupled receptors family 1 profile domain-containing protein n=1 Tax=Pogonophryne albipinna TaxID=1090488 RepID=A0AAD6A6W5_9TELE|nr:hypothetical protein JOQ06_026140 [Pogonophryne albipinna]